MTKLAGAAHIMSMSQTAVQSTSVVALASLQDITVRQTDVYNAILSLGTACNKAIANYLSVPVNEVTGRVFELRQKGLVVESHKAVWNKTGKTVIWWTTPAIPTV